MFKRMILVFLVLAVLLASCGGKKEETPTPQPVPTETPVETVETVEPEAEAEAEIPVETVTVRFVVGDFEQGMFEEIISAFEKDNPDVEIKLVSLNEVLDVGVMGGDWPDDAWVKLASAGDVINLQPPREAIESGLLLDLTPSLESDPNAQPDDFYPGTLSACQRAGGTWCLPRIADYLLVFFDKDAFDEVGEPYPEIGWTWDDLLIKAAALTQREGDEVSRWGFVLPSNWHAYLIDSWVGPLVDETGEQPEPLFDRPEVLEAVAWYTDLYLEHEVMPIYPDPDKDAELAVPEGQKLIHEQMAAMWLQSSATWSWLAPQRNLGVVPLPLDAPGSEGRAENTSFFTINGAAISAGTANPEAAWRWVNYLSRQTMAFYGLMMVPARQSVTQAGDFWENVDDELEDALIFAVDHGYVMQNRPGYEAFSDAINQVLAGEFTVADALAEAEVRALANLDEEMAEREAATPVPTVVVAEEEEQPVDPNAITIVFSPGPSGILSLGAFRDLADSFQEENPQVVVEVKLPDFFTGGTPTIKDLAQDNDCFGWSPTFQDPENLEAILSLDPFLDADPSFDTDDFYPLMLNRFTHQGQLWGLPMEASTYVLEYNKDLFDAAGAPYPQVDPSGDLAAVWTIDDFLQSAVALTQGEGEEKVYGFVTNFYEVNDLVFMMERLGAQLMNDSVDPPSIDFSDPTVVEAMRWYVDLSNVHGVKPVYAGDISEVIAAGAGALEREALIDDGRAGIWTTMGSLSALSGGGREALNTGVAPLPAGPGTTGAYVAAEGYFISAETEARQTCWQWITFLTGQPEAIQNIPARRSVAESDVFRQKVGDDWAATYLVTMAAADQPSSLQFLEDEPWMAVGLIWLGRAYSQVVKDEALLEEALNQVQDTFDQYRACVISNDAMADEKGWQACVVETDPTFPAFLFGG